MKENKLTEGKILPALLLFALPVLFSLFLQAMYGAVDLLVVGQFAAVADQSGVATGSMVINTITMVVSGLSMGITVLAGEYIGAKKAKEAGRGIGAGICLFGLLSTGLTIACVTGAGKLAALMHAPAEAFFQTTGYIRICSAGFVFIIAYNLIGAVFRGMGDSKTPLITVAIACIVNIAGDLFFVAVLHMGANGAALATVLAQAISVFASLLLLRRRTYPIHLEKSDLHLRKAPVVKILKIGIPIALQEFLVGLSFLFIQSVVNGIGLTQSAGVGVAEKVCAFLMLVGSAYMQSMSAFVAQNNGAGRHDRARKALFIGMATAFLAGAAMGLLSFFGGAALSSIFSKDKEVIAASHAYLKAYGIDCFLTAILFCFIGYFNGCEKTIFVMVQGMVGAFLVRIPIVWLVSQVEGASLFQIGLGTPASSLIQIVLCVIAYAFYEKRRNIKVV